ncbi:MAG: hypothetical protein FWB86_14080 [Treponema sp.]|nr:hypothetical protein [Treponema sp.]
MNKFFLVFLFTVSFTLLITGCASAPAKIQGTGALTVSPGQNESVVVVQRVSSFTGSAIPMRVWINNEEVVSGIRNGGEFQLIIPNGQHTIQAGSSGVDKGNNVVFVANGEAIYFNAVPRMGVIASRFNLTEISRMEL